MTKPRHPDARPRRHHPYPLPRAPLGLLPRLALATALAAGCAAPDAAFDKDAVDVVARTESALTSGDVTGTWYLNVSGFRLTLVISGTTTLTGVLTNENGGTETVDSISTSGTWLEFRRRGNGFNQWYRAMVTQGVLAGRFVHQAALAKPPLTNFTGHVTGWRAGAFSPISVPIAWDLLVNDNYRTHLRIDTDRDGDPVGRFKVYSTVSAGGAGEELDYDVTISSWDGTHLTFTRDLPAMKQVFTGTVSGRTISGTFSQNGSGSSPWKGTQAEVLSYGVGGGWPAANANARLARLRANLATLTMDGNPAATLDTSTVSPVQVITGTAQDNRDDDPTHNPQSYTLQEWTRVFKLTNAFDGTQIKRTVHGYLAVPTTPPPSGGKYRVAIVANGHGGSAFATMNPASMYWYGDGFARRGYLVVAVDVSHRNDSPIYTDYPNGDKPDQGNGAHPSIRTTALDSDWEEDGERAWDVMRAVDFALSRSDADAGHVLLTGLSMGGETATIAAAMDPRIGMSVAAGYSPDMGVIASRSNHGCWRWAHADIREYIDVSDYQALLAPRPFILETGKLDDIFTARTPRFSADKQAMRRSRVAFSDLAAGSKHLHYLHYDGHAYHVGGASSSKPALGVQSATVIGPKTTSSTSWQTDDTTITLATPSLFELIKSMAP